MGRHSKTPFPGARVPLKDWPRGQLAELRFWKIEKSVSIPVKQPKLVQVFLSFPCSTRAGGLFRSARVCEEVLKFCPLAEKRGSLEGVRERGFNNVIFIFFSFERLARDRDRSSHVLSLFLFFFRV